MLRKNFFLTLLTILLTTSLAGCVQPTADPGASANADATANSGAAQTIVAATVSAALSETQGVPVATQPAVVQPVTPSETPAVPPAVQQTATPEVTLAPPEPTAVPALQIAYIDNGNVFVWTEGVGAAGLSITGDATALRISSDGQLVAFLRGDPNSGVAQEMWALNTSGPSNARVLVSAADLAALKPDDGWAIGVNVLNFVWRPGTHDLAYSTLPVYEGPGFSPNKDLRLVNADTLGRSVLFETGQGGMFYYSPNGSQIALVRPDSISLVDASGANLRPSVLAFPLVGTYSEYQYYPNPLWAADSSSLRVAIPPAETLADPLPPTGLWRIPTDGSAAVLLGQVQAMAFAWPDNAFAPGLEKVAYVMLVGEPAANLRELRIANPDGSGDTLFDSGESLEFMAWSPDSTHFFYQINGGARRGIYFGAVGGGYTLITADPGQVRGLRWLDGERYVAFWRSGAEWELRITHVNGSGVFVDSVPDAYPSFDFAP